MWFLGIILIIMSTVRAETIDIRVGTASYTTALTVSTGVSLVFDNKEGQNSNTFGKGVTVNGNLFIVDSGKSNHGMSVNFNGFFTNYGITVLNAANETDFNGFFFNGYNNADFLNTGSLFMASPGNNDMQIINKGNIKNTGVIAYSGYALGGWSWFGDYSQTVTNCGTICLNKVFFNQVSNVQGTGCFTVGAGTEFAMNTNSFPSSQTIYLETDTSMLYFNSAPPSNPVTVAGWGNWNIIGFRKSISEVYVNLVENNIGVTTGDGTYNIVIGEGYDPQAIRVVWDSSLKVPGGDTFKSYIMYSNPPPDGFHPSVCKVCPEIPNYIHQELQSALSTVSSSTSTSSSESSTFSSESVAISSDSSTFSSESSTVSSASSIASSESSIASSECSASSTESSTASSESSTFSSESSTFSSESVATSSDSSTFSSESTTISSESSTVSSESSTVSSESSIASSECSASSTKSSTASSESSNALSESSTFSSESSTFSSESSTFSSDSSTASSESSTALSESSTFSSESSTASSESSTALSESTSSFESTASSDSSTASSDSSTASSNAEGSNSIARLTTHRTPLTTTDSAGETNTDSDVVVDTTDSTVSLTAATSEVTTSSTLVESMPTAPALRNPVKLTGADLISNISVHDNSTGTIHAKPNHFFTINIIVESEEPITKGTKIQFGVPEVFYGNINPFNIYSTESERVGTVSSDEFNVFTITFDGDYGQTHSNTKGSFTFNVKLRYVIPHGKRDLLTLDLSREIVQPFVFTTVSREFVRYLIFDDLTPGADTGDVKPGDVFFFTGDTVPLPISSASSTTLSGIATFTTTGATTNFAGEAETDSGSVTISTDSTGLLTTTSQFASDSDIIEISSSSVKEDEDEDIKTVTDILMSIVTISSCSNHKCHETTAPATWGPVTTTLDNGVVTMYTTWCPETGAETGSKTTIITITSCSDHKCYETSRPATWGPTTSTLTGGEVTVYTTWCHQTGTETGTLTTTTILTITSCSDHKCHTTAVPATWGPVTSTLGSGLETMYTTWCPKTVSDDSILTATPLTRSATSALDSSVVTGYTTWYPVNTNSITVYGTVLCLDDVCKTSTVTDILSPGKSTLETVGTSATGTATHSISTAFNGAAKIVGSVLALAAIPLAYIL